MSLSVAALVTAFEDTTLPAGEWDHRAHLVVALAYARNHVEGDAISRLREGLKKLNAAHGVPTTETRGYHETITLAWFHLVRCFLLENGIRRSLDDLAKDLIETYSSKDTLLRYYSRERLKSREARFGWVEPDLAPLPGTGGDPGDAEWLHELERNATRRLTRTERRVLRRELDRVA